MPVITRKFDKILDYSDVASWWESQGWPVLSLEILGDNGYIAVDINSKEKLACGWVYKLEGSTLGLMEWLVGNPKSSHEYRGLGLNAVIASCNKFAKESGCKALFTMAKHERLKNRYLNLGFQETDSNMTHFVRSIN